MVKPLRNALLAGSVAAAFFAAVSPAAAADFCVDNDVVPAATCQFHWFGMNGANLQDAINQGNGPLFPGRDRVVIGAGVLSIGSTVTIAPPVGEPLDIVGSGSAAGQTELVNNTIASVALDFLPASVTDSSISNLAINVPAVTNPMLGMRARGGRVHDVRFRVTGDTESYHAALLVEGAAPTTIADCEFEVVGVGFETLGMRVRNNSTVTRSSFVTEAALHYGQVGVIVETTAGTGLQHAAFSQTSFKDFDVAISQLDGRLQLSDVLIDTGAVEADQVGIRQRDQSAGTDPVELSGDGLTIVGSGTDARGIDIDTTAGDDSALIDITNSIAVQAGAGSREVVCVDDSGSVATLQLNFSLLALADFLAAVAPGGCTVSTAGDIDRAIEPPQFIDVATGDYRPAAQSPAIDAGNPTAGRLFDEVGLKLDLGGASRFADGNGDGAATIDIGAHELQSQPAAAPPALAITLGKPVGKFKLNRKRGKRKLKRTGFAFTTARRKPRIPLTANLDATLTLTLAKYRAGHRKGSKCMKRKPAGRRRAKRCDLPLRGSQSISVKAGTSYLTFGGKLGRNRLTPGKYRLIVSSNSLNDSKKSVLNVIR